MVTGSVSGGVVCDGNGDWGRVSVGCGLVEEAVAGVVAAASAARAG